MGTNFYLLTDPCSHCGRSDERLHIGKSSAGWCFALHVDPENGINNLDDWKAKWQTGKIVNEYGVVQSPEEMLDMITNRGRDSGWNNRQWLGYASETHFHRSNNSQRGPNNLLRRRIDGRHCIGHGDGTWDLITGEFS